MTGDAWSNGDGEWQVRTPIVVDMVKVRCAVARVIMQRDDLRNADFDRLARLAVTVVKLP